MRGWLLALLAALVALPSAGAVTVGVENPHGPVPATLYFHLLDGLRDAPINTQRPELLFSGTPLPIAAHSTCADEAAGLPPPAGLPLADREWHTLFGYSSPSYVEYGFVEDGKPRLHPERGLGHDVRIHDGAKPVLHWFLATGAPQPGPPAGSAPPLAVPNVVVEATMREAAASIGVDEEDYRQGTVLMHGQSEPATLAGPLTTGATWEEVDGRHVYGFEVPLAVEAPGIIPRATGFTFEVEVYVDNPYCASGRDGDYLMPDAVDHYWDPERLPRVELSILDPLRVESLHPEFVDDVLVVHASVQSAWGNYDVDEASRYNGNRTGGIVARIRDAGGALVQDGLEPAVLVQRYMEHAHFGDPVEATYVWNHTGAPAGLYAFEFAARNDQRTAWANATAAFEVGRGATYGAMEGEEPYAVEPQEPRPMPGPGLAAAAAALGLAAAALRRRAPKV